MPSSAAEIGGLLRRARESRGLDLLTVHDRLERPITQLEAIEAGDLDGLPDQALALSTLRRYAAFLALDSDALTLQMIEAWSRAPSSYGRRPLRGNGHRAANGVVTGVSAAPDHLRAFTQTGQVPPVTGAGTSGHATDGSDAVRHGVGNGPPTGTLSVVPREEIRETRRAMSRARRQRSAPLPLRAVTWLVTILLVAAVVGAGIQLWRPGLFARWHVVHVVGTSGGTAAAAGPPPSHHTPSTAPAAVRLTSSPTAGASSATYTVAAQRFAVAVVASAPCWVEATVPGSSVPVFGGVLAGGQQHIFDVGPASSLSVQVGASTVTLGVAVNGKLAFLTKPRTTPFTYVFTGQSPR